MILFGIVLLSACTNNETDLNGVWESASSKTNEVFVIELHQQDSSNVVGYLTIPNKGISKIELTDVSFYNDTVSLLHDRYDFNFVGIIKGDSLIGFQNNENTIDKFSRIDLAKKRPQTPVGTKGYNDEDVYLLNEKDKIILSGTLSIPTGDSKTPAIILITGSGQQDRDETIFYHRPFQIISDHLAKQGIAVLRLDDRGVGASGGNAHGKTSKDYAEDILSAISFLEKHDRIDSKSIGLFGHSEGGIIALLAAKQKPSVRFIVTYGSPYTTGKELALNQLKTYFRSVSNDKESIESVLQLYDQIFNTLISTGLSNKGKPIIEKQFEYWLNANRDNPDALSFIGFTPKLIKDINARDNFLKTVVLPYLHPWMIYVLRYQPEKVIDSIDSEILAIFGEKDQQVISSLNVAAVDLLNNTRSISIEKVVIKDLNHFMQTSNTGSITEVYEIEETVSPKILETVSSWVKYKSTTKTK